MEGPVGAQQYSYEELKAMVDEAARHGIKVAAHAHGTDGIKAAVRAGVASIEHGSMLDDEAIALMKQHGTWLVPTTYLADRINLAVLPPNIQQKARTVLPLARASLRKAIASGVKIAFGTDAAVFPHGENAREFAVLTSLGMPPIEALRAATIYAADLIGKTDRENYGDVLMAVMTARRVRESGFVPLLAGAHPGFLEQMRLAGEPCEGVDMRRPPAGLAGGIFFGGGYFAHFHLNGRRWCKRWLEESFFIDAYRSLKEAGLPYIVFSVECGPLQSREVRRWTARTATESSRSIRSGSVTGQSHRWTLSGASGSTLRTRF